MKNNFTPTVYGVGYLGNRRRKDNIQAYGYWTNLLNRCYFKSNGNYKDCFVCTEWLCFENFEKWFKDNHVLGHQLDKDILFKNNKCYSPEKCCFVPAEINCLFTKTNKKRGKYAIGVSLLQNKYFKVGFSKYGCIEYFGIYLDEMTAFNVYKQEKEKYIRELAQIYFESGKISETVYNALMAYEVDLTD